MLQKMNEYIKGWVAGVIVALVGATFVFWGLSSYVSRSSGANAAVAKVNGVKISAQTFSSEYRRMKTAYQQQTGVATLSPQADQQLKQYLLQQLVMQQALLQSAKQQGFAISMAQVRLLLMQDPEFQVDGKFSQQKLQYAMYSGGTRSPGAFFAKLQQNFLVGQVRGGILQSSFVLPDELAQSYGLLNQTRDFGYFTIPVAGFLSKDKVSADEIKNYYDSHQAQYKTPQQASFDYLMLDPDVLTKSIEVSPSEIQQFYDDHSANYATPKRWQASIATIKLAQGSDQATQQKALDDMSQLSKSLTATADFAALAKQHNADFSTQWLVASNNIVNVKVLESLKPGAYSTTMQTGEGLVIVRLDQVQQAKTQSLAEVQDKISSMLRSQKLEQVMSNDTEQLNNLTYTNPDTLSPAAKQLGLTIKHTELMPSSGAQSGLFADSAIIQAAFGDEVFKQGYNSNPVILKSGTVVVLRRNKVEPSSVVPLDKVSSGISDLLVHQKAEQLAGVEVYTIQQSLQKGTSPQQLAKQYQLTWVSKKQVARDTKDLPVQLLDTVFTTVLNGHNQPSYNSVLQDNKVYYVVAVSNWQSGDIKDADSQQVDSLQSDLASSLAQFDYAAYVKSANGQAKIKLYQPVLDGIS